MKETHPKNSVTRASMVGEAERMKNFSFKTPATRIDVPGCTFGLFRFVKRGEGSLPRYCLEMRF